jgi:RNA polymerase sigma-70 factor (ECF subfamily)
MYGQYQAMVLQLCTGFVKGEPQLAADLCQEVFINVWNALDKFQGRSSLKTWLYRITVNTCLQYVRKQSKRQEVALDGLENHLTDNQAANVNNPQVLYQAIGQLSEVDRLLIMMVLEELSYEEISEIIGITQANLRARVHRIKSKLKKIIQYES